MKSFNISDVFKRQARYIAAAVALLLTLIMPAFANAAQVTTRSVQLSSASAGATNVTYTVNFTAINGAGAVVIDFCSDSPLLGATCTAPGGFDVSGATPSAGFTVDSTAGATTASKITLTGTIAAGDVSITLTGVNNPTDAGALYARIVTYTNATGAEAYTSADPGTHVDDGGVAMSITNTIGVSGAVLETMTFCVAGPSSTDTDPITDNCKNVENVADPLPAPTLKLGKDTGGVIALASDAVYSGTIYTQISTNASQGAVINLKSSATGCGGLINSSAPSQCYIKPALTTDLAAGTATFGVKTGAANVDPTNGTIQPVGNYNASTYALNWTSGDATGVTSTYGDPILNTDSKPANNMNMPLTFGASVSNNTPAGNYSADLSLVATGKF